MLIMLGLLSPQTPSGKEGTRPYSAREANCSKSVEELSKKEQIAKELNGRARRIAAN
jgi:hypothetical protein